jgi:hypothetical protein
MRPSSKQDAPDPSHSYERSHPDREGGLDRKYEDQKTSDKMEQSVTHRQNPKRQINGDDVVNRRGGKAKDTPKRSTSNASPSTGSAGKK